LPALIESDPDDVHHALRMTPLVDPAIESYIDELFGHEPALLAELRRETHETCEYPLMLSGAVVGQLLHLLVQSTRVELAVEIGTFTGYSAHYIANALAPNGRLITCDINPSTAQLARRYFARAPYGNSIELALAPALQTIEQIKAHGQQIDFVFIDADKINYPNYYEAVVDLVRPGGLIVADNTLWSGKVVSPADDDTRAIDAFNRRVANDPRVHAVLLSVRDGLTLCRKLQ
jgi:caffeoyl-CoA O-methyltransferase